jgi:DNA-binding transcriptional MerR regulator
METSDFDQTIGEVAREAGLTTPTIRLYAKLGLLDCRKLSNGFSTYQRGAGAKARQIHADRLKNRFRRRSA